MLHARPDYQTRIQDSENKIPAEEAVFLLRAQDSLAADTVRYWVKRAKAQLSADRKASKGAPIPNEAARKKAIVLAEAHAFRMDDWPKKKPADVV